MVFLVCVCVRVCVYMYVFVCTCMCLCVLWIPRIKVDLYHTNILLYYCYDDLLPCRYSVVLLCDDPLPSLLMIASLFELVLGSL